MKTRIILLVVSIALGLFVQSSNAQLGKKQYVGGKKVEADSLKVNTGARFQGAVTFNSTATFTGGTFLATQAPVTITISNSATFGDTLNLTGATSGAINIRCGKGATDSVKVIKGLSANKYYIFSIIADDSTVRFQDGVNLKLGASRVLDKASDRLFVWSDGTSVFEIAFSSND